MTNPNPKKPDILTREEFKHAIGMLIQSATINNIDIRGSWLYRNKNNERDWEVMVMELKKDNSY